MGRFFGPSPNILSAKGFFRGSAGPSAQPKTWTTLVTGFESVADVWFRIYWLNSHWIITASQPGVRIAVYTSVNGVNWTQRVVFAGATGLQFPGATFGAGLYAVTGQQSGVVPRLRTSPDLVTWTSRSMGFLTGASPQDPVFGNGVFLVVANVGASTQYATSPDGITWTQRTVYVPQFWLQPIFDGTQFVAVVQNPTAQNKVVTSPDGINWTEQPAVFTIANPGFMGNRAQSQYVVGDALTTNGDSLNGALTAVSPINFNDPAGNPTGWVVFGTGSDWSRCNSVNSSVESSPDGLTWVQDILPPAAATIDNMAWNGTEWIAVGSQTGGTNYAATRGP